jgi:hypothetical protein
MLRNNCDGVCWIKRQARDVNKLFSNADFSVQLFFIYSIFESKNCTLYNVKISRIWVHNSSLLALQETI